VWRGGGYLFTPNPEEPKILYGHYNLRNGKFQEIAMEENKGRVTDFLGTYFDRSVVMRIVRGAEIASWVVLVVYALQLLVSVTTFVLSYTRGFMQGLGFTDMFQQVLYVLEQPFRGIVYFIGLQAVAKILLMFMDIEDNTRRAARK
jgi:hypothetical protein